MSTEQKLAELRSAIAKVCPEIMELSFGCRVLLDGGYTPRGIHIVYHRNDDVYEAANVGHTEIMTNETTSFTCSGRADYAKLREVLGHPIQLHHVLRAIDDKIESGDYHMDMDGAITIDEYDADGDCVNTEVAKWNLSRPSLDEQTSELINFLHEVICQEK